MIFCNLSFTFASDGGDAFEEHDVPAAEPMNRDVPLSRQPSAARPAASADPWAPLDPHHASAADNKPLKRGKTWREPKLPTSLIPIAAIKQVRVGLPKVTNFNTPCFGCSQKVFASLRVKAAARRGQSDTQEEPQQDAALVAEDVAASVYDWNAGDDGQFHEELGSDDEAVLPPLPSLHAEDAQVPSRQQEQPDLIIDDMHSFQARCRSYMCGAPFFPSPQHFFCAPSESMAGRALRRDGRDSPIMYACFPALFIVLTRSFSQISQFEFGNGRISWIHC